MGQRFPAGFLWGAATSSHQVEGNNRLNDWWAWEQTPGHIHDGSVSGMASDWWQRAEDDLALAAELGHNAHRLSIEWSRLQPTPDGWDPEPLARYRRLLERMHALGIEPLVTLHHFTLPVWLAERGGWRNARIVALFVRYAERVVEALGEQCTLWCTINKPMVQLVYGMLFKVWPPGKGGPLGVMQGLRHMVRAHAASYSRIHALQPDARVGFAKHVHLFDAADPSRWQDRLAAGAFDALFNTRPLRMLARGCHPERMQRVHSGQCGRPGVHRQRLAGHITSGQRPPRYLDWIGLNYYSRSMVRCGLRYRNPWLLQRFVSPDAPYSMDGWGEIYPEGLERSLRRMGDLGVPVHVTEFGVPDNSDAQRPQFIVDHVAAMERALAAGVDLRGSFFWSLVDNFEWAEGWAARFGLIGVDPETQGRTVRDSAEVYRRIAAANGDVQAAGLVGDWQARQKGETL